jgi:hypothetical protein
VQLRLCQYVYLSTSTASKLSTCSSFCVIICTSVRVYCAIIRTFVHAGGLALSVTERCEGGGGGGCLLDTVEHGQYHYRSLPTCLDSPDNDEADGHSGVIAVMLGTQASAYVSICQHTSAYATLASSLLC